MRFEHSGARLAYHCLRGLPHYPVLIESDVDPIGQGFHTLWQILQQCSFPVPGLVLDGDPDGYVHEDRSFALSIASE